MLPHNLVALKDCCKCLLHLPRLQDGQEIEFAYTHVIKPMQVRSEIEELLHIVREKRPKVVVEIGTATGGTLFLLCRNVAQDALILSIDLRKGRFGNGYPLAKAPLYKSFATGRQKVALIRGNSHLEETERKAKKILMDRKVEFMFIDGDHTYEGVKADFQMYSKLVAPGGVVAFHDIAEHPAETGCDVSRFWNEIKGCYRHTEIIENPRQAWAGIGVLYV